MEDGIKSVERAFQILESVSLAKNGVGITELSSSLRMYKSTIHRVLSTLVSAGYAEQDSQTGRYKLGYKLVEVSSRLLNNLDVRREALPYLQELADETKEVVHLVVLDQGQVVYIEKVEGTETIRMHSRVGTRAPVHCTGVGKAILAHLPQTNINEILQVHGLPFHTPYTIATEEGLYQELQKIRQQGYAFDLEENEIGITCVAAPIWDHRKLVAASISVSAPTMRMQETRLQELAQFVKEIGLKISGRLGY